MHSSNFNVCQRNSKAAHAIDAYIVQDGLDLNIRQLSGLNVSISRM